MISQQSPGLRASASADRLGENALCVGMLKHPAAAKCFHERDSRLQGNLRQQKRVVSSVRVSHIDSFRGRFASTTMAELSAAGNGGGQGGARPTAKAGVV